MNLRAWLMVSLVAVLPLSGCVIVNRSPGNVTFTWSFQGNGCSMVPDVRNVAIRIPGQTLMNDGVFACSTNGVAGIVLHDFRGGSYSFTLEGRDFNGAVLYSKSGTFIVDGDVSVAVDMSSVTSGGSVAYLSWDFPPNSASQNPDCSQAGVANMLVSIDGRGAYSVSCAEGQSASGSVTPELAAGTHTLVLSGVNAQGYEYYAKSTSFTTRAGQSTSQTFTMDWAVGGAAVRWTVTSGGVTSSCGAAGIQNVYVNFRDSAGAFVYSGAGDPQPCSAAGIVYSFLKPGTYSVFLQANGSGTSVYSSDQQFPPSVTVAAGVFKQFNDGQNILLNRTQ